LVTEETDEIASPAAAASESGAGGAKTALDSRF